MNSKLNHSAPLNSNRLARVVQFSILFALLFSIYFETIISTMKEWFGYSVSHGPLIWAISIYMIWKKRDYLREIKIQPELIKGSFLLILGCILLIAGRLSITMLVQQVSLIVTLLGIVWLLLGSAYQNSLYSSVLLVFAFPIFGPILESQTIHFQLTAAYIASSILAVAGLPFLEAVKCSLSSH
jgi:exosortase